MSVKNYRRISVLLQADSLLTLLHPVSYFAYLSKLEL